MANRNKAKGTLWETTILRYLREALDPQAYKPRPEGLDDVGDIRASGIVWQAKDWRRWEDAIREGLDGAVLQAKNAGLPLGVAVVKRARRSVDDAYAVLRLGDFAALVRHLRETEEEVALLRTEVEILRSVR